MIDICLPQIENLHPVRSDAFGENLNLYYENLNLDYCILDRTNMDHIVEH